MAAPDGPCNLVQMASSYLMKEAKGDSRSACGLMPTLTLESLAMGKEKEGESTHHQHAGGRGAEFQMKERASTSAEAASGCLTFSRLSVASSKRLVKHQLEAMLDQKRIKYPKSAKKEELESMLKLAKSLEHGVHDMGSSINCGNVLSVAVTLPTFWEALKHWKYIGKLGAINRSFKSVIACDTAWLNVVKQMPRQSVKSMSIVLAVPPSHLTGMRFPQQGLSIALAEHGTTGNMHVARYKKSLQRQKNIAKPRKPRVPPRLLYGGYVGCGTCPDCRNRRLYDMFMADFYGEDYGDESAYGIYYSEDCLSDYGSEDEFGHQEENRCAMM